MDKPTDKDALTVELLACPFCGGASEMWASNGVPYDSLQAGGSRHVECLDCGASGPIEPPPRNGRAWNTRHLTTKSVEASGSEGETPTEREKRWLALAAKLRGDDTPAPAGELEEMRMALHMIDVEASNTIPPDGKDAAFAALGRIIRIINPFRIHPGATTKGGEDA